MGTTILLTTHYMDEAQELADRVAIIARGKIQTVGTPETIGGRHNGTARVRFRLPGDLIGIPVDPGALRVTDDTVEITTDSPTAVLHRVTGWALDHGPELVGLTVSRPTLEDVYMDLAGGDDE